MWKSLIAVGLIACTQASSWNKEITRRDLDQMDLLKEFESWSIEFNRNYGTVDSAAHKFKIWVGNMFKIASINDEELTYKLRMNQFGDMTGDEFRLAVHGKDGRCFKSDETYKLFESKPLGTERVGANPTSVDWTTKGVVTPVKNQGQCGSCWAFSATGAMECDYAIKTGTLNSLSEQQLVDCAGARYGCAGCNGGQMYGAMEYAANEGGLCLESAYKYTARNGECKATTCGKKYDAPTGKGYTPVTKDSEPKMEDATVAGCVSIGIEADQYAFQYYSSGVLTGTCGTNIDHGVLIVGYGTSGSQDYWKVKNSWGTTWGEKGYVLICRNCNKNGGAGECGILTEGNVPNY